MLQCEDPSAEEGPTDRPGQQAPDGARAPGSNSSRYGDGSWYPSTSTSILASTDFSPPMPTP